jgi:hypothetical protein
LGTPRGRTLGKGYGIKWGVIGNIHEEHHEELIYNLGNTLRIVWEHDGNTRKTNSLSPPS